MEKRLAAILISDIVGYTKLMEEDTEGTVMAWSDARDNVVEPQVEAASGRLVKFMGDGFLAEFSTLLLQPHCQFCWSINHQACSMLLKFFNFPETPTHSNRTTARIRGSLHIDTGIPNQAYCFDWQAKFLSNQLNPS